MKSTYAGDEIIDDDLVLNKRRYKNFRKQWDGIDSDVASEDFEELLDQQDMAHCTKEEDRVAVPDNPKIRRVSGTKTSAEKHFKPHRQRPGSSSQGPPRPRSRARTRARARSRRPTRARTRARARSQTPRKGAEQGGVDDGSELSSASSEEEDGSPGSCKS